MKLSKEIPAKRNMLEFLISKLALMTVEPTHPGDMRISELRFIEAIEEASVMTEEDANKVILKVDKWTLTVSNEKDLMERRAKGYVELYATKYNKYFKDTKKYNPQVARINHTIVHIYEEFTDTSKRERYIYYDEEWQRKTHSLFDSSPLNSKNVQSSLYGLETYPVPHQILFYKLQNLILKLQDLTIFAANIDNMVETLRKNNPERVIEIFYKCKTKSEKELKYLLHALNLKMLEEIFPQLVSDLRTMDFKDFIVKYYHELDIAEFNYLIPIYQMVLKETYGINPDEGNLYDVSNGININEKIRRIEILRVLMAHIDEFDLKGRKVPKEDKYYVSSSFMAMLMEKVEIPPLKEKDFVTYFQNHYKGTYVPVKYGAENKAKNKIDKSSDKYKDFQAKADELIKKIQEHANLDGKRKIAVNDNNNQHCSTLARVFA